MNCLSNIVSAPTEITIEKLDEVTKTIGEKVKKVAELFGVVLCWFLANAMFAMFINRVNGVSFDMLRFVNGGLSEITTLDLSMYVAVFFESKLSCIISLATLFVCGWGYTRLLASAELVENCQEKVHNNAMYTQYGVQNDAYVISYKHQVAFIS